MEAKIQQTECTRVYTGILRNIQPTNRNGNGCAETLACILHQYPGCCHAGNRRRTDASERWAGPRSIAIAMNRGKLKFSRIWTSQGRDRARALNKLQFSFTHENFPLCLPFTMVTSRPETDWCNMRARATILPVRSRTNPGRSLRVVVGCIR